MFKIESYVTPILLSYVDKYVRDFKPADAQVSLWGGGVALHNLVLKADVLQQEMALPFTLVSGRIHELLIQVPWTKIMSEPIVVTIDTIECVLSLNVPTTTDDGPPPDSPSRKTQLVEAPPGYMQALVRRIVSNIALRVHHLIVKYVQDDIVLSLNVKHLAVDSAGSNWEPAFADIEQVQPVIRRLVRLDDLTLCLDRTDADGKIRVYQEPLLYRCQLNLRVLTRLVSANMRRASSLSIQLRSSKLAWGVTSDQLTLLLRLYRERLAIGLKPPTPSPKTANTMQAAPLHTTSSNSAEPARQESWSEWAWSWLPTLERDADHDSPVSPSPVPVHFTAYLDDVSLVFKVMELESGSRKRPRVILELVANHAAVKSYTCSPTTSKIRLGIRKLTVLSKGKCVCGQLDYCASYDEPTVYLRKVEDSPEEWDWPDLQLGEGIEAATVADELYRSTPDLVQGATESHQSDPGQPEQPAPERTEQKDESDELWQTLSPQLHIEYIHERAPPDAYTNPYDNPPLDFEYSDWAEECVMKIAVSPVEVRVCAGLLHRLATLHAIYRDLPPVPIPELGMRTLTVEECDALSENLPQRRVSVEACGLRVRVLPWEHGDRPPLPPLALDINLPSATVLLSRPLYPHRVCSAACQMPEESGPLWQGARLHATLTVSAAEASLAPLTGALAKPCARADIRAVAHILLNKEMFTRTEAVLFSYSLKISEANVCGSSARLQAAWQVPLSLRAERPSPALRLTTLASDALNDEECVAIDLTFEECVLRGYVTSNTNTHIMTLQSAKATALHEPKGESLKQAWVFSAPDAPTSSPYLRLAVQWCAQPLASSLDYMGIWTEPTAICVDPLFIAWLAYKPMLKQGGELTSRRHLSQQFFEQCDSLSLLGSAKNMYSSQYFMRRRTTPPSSGRGGSKLSAELVHVRPRSVGSSEKAESREAKPTPDQPKPVEIWWCGERLVALHERLRRMLVSMELGLTLVYVTLSPASALDSGTVRDAMERHASAAQRVLALSLGRMCMYSSTITKHFWHDIKHDGPTFVTPKPDQGPALDAFPLKIRLADVSCYTLEVRAGTDKTGRDKSMKALRSQLKTPLIATPRTVLELVTTTITVSVVTKALPARPPPKREPAKQPQPNVQDEKMKYFTAGMDFKPTTLKEFVRGPAKRNKSQEVPEKKAESAPAQASPSGPVISLGVHLHADTPPLVVRLEHDQVHIVAAAVHCFTHIVALLRRSPLHVPRSYSSISLGGSHRSLIRSVSDIEEQRTPSDESASENRSELISIYESRSAKDVGVNLKTFFWFQWVVSRATLVAATHQVKLAFDADDIIATVDLQTHYNQLKIKVASASVRHYERSGSDEWTAGVLGGRVLEAREPTNSKEDNHFLSVTVTQARISNLPASWKEELHPKLLEHKASMDSMWEIYATLAPLEVVLQPSILEQIVSLVHEMAPRSFCPLQKEPAQTQNIWQWPFLYVTAGGLRLLLTQQQESNEKDDTFMFVLGKATISPYPENPICRRAINTGTESGWLAGGGGFNGRQYEIFVKNVSVRTAQFRQLVTLEASEAEMLKAGTGAENPALKWTQPVVAPNITPVLHAVDIACVLAPALYVAGALTCGPAVELNLVSDCALELSLDQLVLAQRVTRDVYTALDRQGSEEVLFDEEKHGACPYATLLMDVPREPPELQASSSDTLLEDGKSVSEVGRSLADSGVETVASTRYRAEDGSQITPAIKKSLSVAFVGPLADAWDYVEVFVTMGVIELSLYAADDGSPELVMLRAPPHWEGPAASPPAADQQVLPEESKGLGEASKRDNSASPVASKSLTETVRNADHGQTKLELPTKLPQARRSEGNLPLIHVTLSQPNLYYWRKKSQKTWQVSLFDAWMGLGAGQIAGQWHAPLFSTARGASDPVTEIPPALATLKLVLPSLGLGSGASRGSVRVDVERPLMLHACTDTLRRLLDTYALIKRTISTPKASSEEKVRIRKATPPSSLYRLKLFLVLHSIESVTLVSGQMGVTGNEGAAGWDSLSLQLGAGSRPDRLCLRALLAAVVVSTGPAGDGRHVLLQPVMLGVEVEASWESWRRAEGGLLAREPSVSACVEVDRACVDLRAQDVAALARVREALLSLAPHLAPMSVESNQPSSDSVGVTLAQQSAFSKRSSVYAETPEDHYYKDDLRSGAFKIVSGGQMPMAYQVKLHKHAVSWRYPHPRAITRLVAFPLPGQDTGTPCVLELYNPLLSQWETHTHLTLPVSEPTELQLYVTPPDAVFAVMWRLRVCDEPDLPPPPFEFNSARFMPRPDPLIYESSVDADLTPASCGVTAEQLCSAVRVDSCFSQRVTPRMRIVTRVADLQLHAHNTPSTYISEGCSLEGYYVPKPLIRCHRVLTLSARDLTMQANLASPSGALFIFHTYLSSDIVDCATGAMERLVSEFRCQGGVSIPADESSRARLALSPVHVALHVPRLRTLHALAKDWRSLVTQYIRGVAEETRVEACGDREAAEAALEGRISLWIHNTCSVALRLGQEDTEEVLPLGPGTSLAYRWCSPTAAKRLRFSVASPSADWQWSKSIPFSGGASRVRVAESGDGGAGSSKQAPPPHTAPIFLHTLVEELGAHRRLTLAGRLCPVNMLRHALLYKVRARSNGGSWRTVSSGEMPAETIANSVLCAADIEMALKIKFIGHDTGWSGDIPLKECPKENVPWLVKVPSSGESAFTCVWCRVARARSDGRVLATIWPLYVLYSHLPLDTDVLIATEPTAPGDEPTSVVQTALGRGAATQLAAPGTTSARHSLSLQYREIECPVTREAIPLHYGVTDTSVFDKRTPVNTIDEVIAETNLWLERGGAAVPSGWPYSVVTKHWTGRWQPALLQPRCDVMVRYSPIRAGGGCSLEVCLCPMVLLCNAAPLALTLRAHDAAPLCKLEPGTAVSPPSAVLKKPFFISVEKGRETFVSGELALSGAELGRYGSPPPGRLALDHTTDLAILCNHKVALVTMYYEIKDEINVLGMSSTYMLINRMNTDILVSAMAVPNDLGDDTVLRPATYKSVEPTAEGSIQGTPLCRFWMAGRWRGSDPGDLRLYLCISLNEGSLQAAPLRVGQPPLRRALACADADGYSVAIVATQMRHEGRWVVTVSPDPCPQLAVHNGTQVALSLAQPHDEHTTSKVMVVPECEGTRWVCSVAPDSMTHYSTPAHCARYPPSPPAATPAPPPSQPLTFLTFAQTKEEGEMVWCEPVCVAEGERLLQLSGLTVKLRVRPHPHTTLLELRHVDQDDISASDIRKRLFGAFYSDDIAGSLTDTKKQSDFHNLERVNAEDKLLELESTLQGETPREAIDDVLPSTSTAHTSSFIPTTSTVPTDSVNDVINQSDAKNIDSQKTKASSTVVLLSEASRNSFDGDVESQRILRTASDNSAAETVFQDVSDPEWEERGLWSACDRLRVVSCGVGVELAAAADTRPLLAVHATRAALLVRHEARRTKTTLAMADVQIDNLQYESGQFDFAVVATTRGEDTAPEPWPSQWNPFGVQGAYATRQKQARALVQLTHDSWTVQNTKYTALTEVEARLGPLALYVEDAYVTAIATLCRAAVASGAGGAVGAGGDAGLLREEAALRAPLLLRKLRLHPLDLTLTLHTAVRMYIALDQSPLRLSAFELSDAMTSPERLTHALTVHYLSAAILGAGWVVGGLELLGAPGALAARVGGARGGVRGVASAAAAALVHSLSAWAGSLARNLDLLAGDEEHSRRAAAARRRPPASLAAGLAAGITNFAINILGAVGGLAHHPLVGVAVGESESSATALRRGLVGALAKPLSATADLVAFAGHGLLTQTGWDAVPQVVSSWRMSAVSEGGWRRDCVRWSFRLAELGALAGFCALCDNAPLLLLLTHKSLVVADPETERIVEMIDFRYCSIGPYQGQIIELIVTQKRQSKVIEPRGNEDDEYQMSAAAMARVARYTGTGGAAGAAAGAGGETRVFSLLPTPAHAHSLHATLLAAIHHNSPNHFPLL